MAGDVVFALAAPEASSESPEVLPMVVLGAIMVATYVVIAFEWMHKSLAAQLGALVAIVAALAFGLFESYDEVHDVVGHELGVLGVIVGTSILVDVASHSGLFHFIAVKIVKRTRGDPKKLFAVVTVVTMAFVTLLTIAPGTLIVVSLALVVTKALDIDPKPYVMVVALVANSGALMTLASGIATLMLATASEMPYAFFFRVTTPLAIITAAIAYFMLKRFYGKLIVAPGTPEERAEKVAQFDEWALVRDRRVFYRCAIILAITIVGFATGRQLGVGLDFVALAGGLAALLLSGHSVEHAIKVVKWPVVLFFIGLFVIIGAVERSHLLGALADSLLGLSGGDPMLTLTLVTGFMLLLSGVVDNIPIAATMIPVVRALEAQGMAVDPLWWCLIVTANVGSNSTPVGSISSVIALSALEKERNVRVSWGEFLRVGGAVLAVQGAFSLVYLLAFQYFDLYPAR